jgi:hypothetical protein
MKAKFDKEALIKNRFWIGLGASVLFVLIAFFCVVSVRGDAVDLWKKADTTNTELKGVMGRRLDLRNEKWIDRMKEETAAALRQKLVVWGDSYDAQVKAEREPLPKDGAAPEGPAGAGPVAVSTDPPKPRRGKLLKIGNPLIIWPEDIRDHTVDVGTGFKFKMPLHECDFGWKIDIVPIDYKLAYAKQFDDLVKSKDLELLNEEKQTGAMRVFGNAGSNEANLKAMLSPQQFTPRPVMSNEAWTLQEDFALKRDVLKAIVEANQTLSNMQPEWKLVQPPEAPKKEEANDAAAAPAPAAAAPSDKPADAKEPAAPNQIDKKRFYNTTWLRGMAANEEEKKEGDKPAAPRPTHLEWWQGWQLDLELANEGGNVVLKGAASNWGNAVGTPDGPLMVYLGDEKGNELPTPLMVPDAGNLPVGKVEGDKYFPGRRELKPLPAPKDAKKIVRVQRVATKPQIDHQRFFNATWLVDLKLVPGQGGVGAAVEGEVINRGGRMSLPAVFEVTCIDTNNNEFKDILLKLPKGDPLKAGEKKEFVRMEIRRATPPKRIVSVRQIFDWRSVPVKQINKIAFTDDAHKHSDRTRVRSPLKTYRFDRKDPSPPAAVAPPTTTPGTDSSTPAGPGFVDSSGGTNPGGAARGPALQKSPDHGIPLNRYYEETDEVRRVPVAVVLVVDAPYMNDVLAAFANSRLRIQVTQVVWNRMHGGLPRPEFFKKAGGGGGAFAPGADRSGGSPVGPVGAAGAGGSAQLPGGGGYPGFPGGAGGTGGPPTGPRGPVSVEEETSEIEVQIYGMISLYESPDAQAKLEDMKQKATTQAATTPPVAPTQ